eukprot:1843713-Pyramimonas_sp.AAC.1
MRSANESVHSEHSYGFLGVAGVRVGRCTVVHFYKGSWPCDMDKSTAMCTAVSLLPGIALV